MTDPELKGLRPWSPYMALEERVQREDEVRWARREESRPLFLEREPKKKGPTIIKCLTFLLP